MREVTVTHAAVSTWKNYSNYPNQERTMRNIRIITMLTVLVCGFQWIACRPGQKDTGSSGGITPAEKWTAANWPEITGKKPDPAIEKRIKDLLSVMSLDEKIGQMVQIEIRSFSTEDMKKYRFGSVLNGGGSWPHENKHSEVSEWVSLADSIWHAGVEDWKHPIPPIWGIDAVHGNNNVIGATIFPHNIGLGAAGDTGLMYKIGQVTAKEVAITGLDWDFAPTVAVVRDDRWGRTYESYSEEPNLVASCAASIISGMQGTFGEENVLATAKHYLGDGGTGNGDDRGNTTVSEKELSQIHAVGYYAAIKAGVQVVMASFSSWQGKKMHGHRYLLTEILKGRMGFDGFVVSDWNAIEEVEGCSKSSCPQAVNAGIDMFMIPFKNDWKVFVDKMKKQITDGEVSMERIDDAVSRILRVKLRTGVFDKPSPANRKLAGKTELLGAPEHRACAREAVRKSLVLLKNDKKTLPLERGSRILVAGCGADSIALQAGGWSLTWQGNKNSNKDFSGATSILDGIREVAENVQYDPNGKSADSKKHDVAIVVIGERPYAEFRGDIEGGLTLEHARTHPEDIAVLESIKQAGVPIVTVFLSGRPLCVNRELNSSDAFVAAWLPGSEGDGISDVLFKTKEGKVNYDFSGKLSFSWPKKPCQAAVNVNDSVYEPLFPFGYGLTYTSKMSPVGRVEEFTVEGYGCNESKPDVIPEDSVITVFNGTFNTSNVPWMGGPGNWTGKSGLPESEIPNLTVQTVDDRQGTKDNAIHLQFKGPAYWGMGGPEKNLAGCYVADFSLVFDVFVQSRPENKISAVVLCTFPCQAQVDITNELASLPIGKWREVRIPLGKFAAADFQKISSPFQLSSTGAADLLIADVRWQK
jgi:beta-glucosidase